MAAASGRDGSVPKTPTPVAGYLPL